MFSMETEATLLKIKVDAVEAILLPFSQALKMPPAHLNLEYLRLEIAEFSQCSEKLFHCALKQNYAESLVTQTRELYKRVVGLHAIVMSIKPSSGE